MRELYLQISRMTFRNFNIHRIYCAYIFVLVLESTILSYVTVAQCQKTITSQQILTSDGFPASFPLQVCHYEVVAEPRDSKADYIVAIFDTFEINSEETEQKPLKETNKLEIHDALDENIGSFTDEAPYGVITKINVDRAKPSLKIIFTAVHSVNGSKGFKMHFKLMTNEQLVPNTTFQGIRGSFASPGYPFNYPNNHQQIYKVSTTNSNGVIRFRFSDVSLGEGSKIAVYDGKKITSERLVYSFPEDREPKTNWNYFVSTNTMTVLFQSAPEETARGFNMTYIEYCEYNNIDTPCDDVPELSFIQNLIIVGAGTGALMVVVAIIALICFCSKKCAARRRMNTQAGMQRFE